MLGTLILCLLICAQQYLEAICCLYISYIYIEQDRNENEMLDFKIWMNENMMKKYISMEQKNTEKNYILFSSIRMLFLVQPKCFSNSSEMLDFEFLITTQYSVLT